MGFFSQSNSNGPKTAVLDKGISSTNGSDIVSIHHSSRSKAAASSTSNGKLTQRSKPGEIEVEYITRYDVESAEYEYLVFELICPEKYYPKTFLTPLKSRQQVKKGGVIVPIQPLPIQFPKGQVVKYEGGYVPVSESKQKLQLSKDFDICGDVDDLSDLPFELHVKEEDDDSADNYIFRPYKVPCAMFPSLRNSTTSTEYILMFERVSKTKQQVVLSAIRTVKSNTAVPGSYTNGSVNPSRIRDYRAGGYSTCKSRSWEYIPHKVPLRFSKSGRSRGGRGGEVILYTRGKKIVSVGSYENSKSAEDYFDINYMFLLYAFILFLLVCIPELLGVGFM